MTRDPLPELIARAVYGGIAEEWEIAQLAKNLDAADVHTDSAAKTATKPKPSGHSNTARALLLGTAAESLGTARAFQAARHSVSGAKGAVKEQKAAQRSGKLARFAASPQGRVAEFGLQGVNLAVGLTAAHQLSQAAKDRKRTPVAKYKIPKGGPAQFRFLRPVKHVVTGSAARKTVGSLGEATAAGTKIAVLGAAAGGAYAGHVLTRKPRTPAPDPEPVTKAAVPGRLRPLARNVRAANAGGAGPGLGRHGRPLGPRPGAPGPLGKRLEWVGEISKVDEDKRQVFGWCSLATVDGQPVVDRQNDWVPLEEIEKSAYVYVLESRKGGDMHARVAKGLSAGWTQPRHTADLIESFVATPEKLAKMGLPPDALPHGWWVGFHVTDDAQWGLVKDRKRTAFSIHGSGTREEAVL